MFCPANGALFFFLCIPQPPTSTLFPYTTLFRSSRDEQDVIRANHAVACVDGGAFDDGQNVALHAFPRDVRAMAGFAAGDRKSTRLNSSHQIISYAVFCLKKKTQTASGIRS